MPFAVMGKLFSTLTFTFSTCNNEIWGQSSVTQMNRFNSKLNKSITKNRKENCIKLTAMPLRNKCQYLTLIKIFSYKFFFLNWNALENSYLPFTLFQQLASRSLCPMSNKKSINAELFGTQPLFHHH